MIGTNHAGIMTTETVDTTAQRIKSLAVELRVGSDTVMVPSVTACALANAPLPSGHDPTGDRFVPRGVMAPTTALRGLQPCDTALRRS
jgi:hypothetical protein